MSLSVQVPVCPPGFDCAFLNSCPRYVVDCPEGYFCGSYQGYEGQGNMDYRFAQYNERSSDSEVTRKNKENFIDKNRAIQVKCLFGFFCTSSSEMEVCPADHWCSESTVVPQKCDAFSFCTEGSGFQVNFMSGVIAAVMAVIIFTTSKRMVSQQKKRDQKSHLKDPSSIEETGVGAASSNQIVSKSLVEVSFKDILFQVPASKDKNTLYSGSNKKSKTRIVLPRVSGTIPAGKLSVVLGPTACGKSTLLNLLRTNGNGAISGTVDISLVSENANIRQLTTPDELSKYVGSVPQEDILDRALTIRELLTFNTRARLPHLMSNAEVDGIVNAVLSDLALQHVADSIIGGGENKSANISGGQLKRVNIAVELVALSSPALLLLDEPTAGLDVTIAYDLIQTLETIILNKGITILSVLQQPRAEIFNKIDGNLFLMDIGGNIVYEGPASEVVTYLQSIGFVRPSKDTAAADFCIDVLNGLADRVEDTTASVSQLGTGVMDSSHKSGNDNSVGSSSRRLGHRRVRVGSATSSNDFDLVSAWQQHCMTANNIEKGVIRTTGTVSPTAETTTNCSVSVWTTTSRFINLVQLNAQRLLTIRMRNTSSMMTYFAINLLMAVALSTGFSIYIQDTYLAVLTPPTRVELQGYFPSPLSDYAEKNAGDFGLAQLLFFMSSTLGCSSCLTAVPVFAGQLSLLRRETSAGMSVTAYALGRMLADLLFVVFNAMVYTGTWMLMGHVGSYYDWIVTIVCTAFAASAIGYISSAVSRAGDASVYAIIATFVCCVFNGTEPTLADVSQYPVVSWPWYLSFATWTSEATYITWSTYLTNGGVSSEPVQDGADHYGYQVDNGLGRPIGALIALGIGLRVIAAIILYYKATRAGK